MNAVCDGDLCRCDVANGHRNKAGAYAMAFVKRGLCLRNRGHTIHRGAHYDADAFISGSMQDHCPRELLRRQQTHTA